MTKKIFLIAGHGGSDKGAKGVIYNGHQLYEAELTIIVRNLLFDFMNWSKSDYPNLSFEVIKDDDTLSLNGVIAWLKNPLTKKEDRVIYDIHFNAFNGKATGSEVIIPDEASENEIKLARMIQSANIEVLKLADRGVKRERQTARKSLAIMRPQGINVLDEICFIDNEKDMEAFFENISLLCAKKTKIILDFVSEL